MFFLLGELLKFPLNILSTQSLYNQWSLKKFLARFLGSCIIGPALLGVYFAVLPQYTTLMWEFWKFTRKYTLSRKLYCHSCSSVFHRLLNENALNNTWHCYRALISKLQYDTALQRTVYIQASYYNALQCGIANSHYIVVHCSAVQCTMYVEAIWPHIYNTKCSVVQCSGQCFIWHI